MTIELKVLDKGFVRLEDRMGGDQSVLRAARVSYGKDPEPDKARDRKLITYLLAHDHGTPFEHTGMTFHVKLPIFVARQWIRHRIGVSFNELSARYTEMKDEFYIPEKWRAQDTKNRQGSTPEEPMASMAPLIHINKESMMVYRGLVENGVAREMARMVLPVNLYTEWYFTSNARSLMNFIRLRSDNHAQWETRKYSHAMAAIFRGLMPMAFDAMLEEMGKDEKAGKRDYLELREYLCNHLVAA